MTRLLAALAALAAALTLASTVSAAGTPGQHSPAWKPPTLTVTNPSTGVLDLAWQNVPGSYVTVFSFDSGVCRYGCETRATNTGDDTIDNPNAVGTTLGLQVCSSDVQPQVCTSRVWITVN